MSVIGGILHLRGGSLRPGCAADLLATDTERVCARSEHWTFGRISLAHGMLSEDYGSTKSPIARNPESGLVVLFNGRIDNRQVLEKDLFGARHSDRVHSDAELVLESFRLRGDRSVAHIEGDFVFVVWDDRSQTLYCIRDRMGARPLCYTVSESLFAFASYSEPLLTCPGITGRPNPDLLAYLMFPEFHDLDTSAAWHEGICSLQPGQILTVDESGRTKSRHYWQLEPEDFAKYACAQECSEAFLEVFDRAIKRRTHGLGNVAQMLSGGLDSAAIGAMLARQARGAASHKIHSYSVVNDEIEQSVESRCIAELVTAFHTHPRFVHVPSLSEDPGIADTMEIAWRAPHPVDNDLLLPSLLCRAASADGHRTMLHGMAGDLALHTPIFYPRYHLASGNVLTAWRECLAASKNNTHLVGQSPASLFIRSLRGAVLPRTLRRVRSVLRSRRHLKARLEGTFLDRELIEIQRILPRVIDTEARLHRLASSGLEGNIKDALFGLHGIPSGLTGYDRVGSRQGIDLSDPWADRDVVEFLARIPLEFRVSEGWTKFLVRYSFRQELPSSVRFRKDKEHLGWMITKRLMSESDGVLRDTLSVPREVVDGFLDYARMKAALESYLAKDQDTLLDDTSAFRLATLVRWMDRSAKAASHKPAVE